MSLLTVVRHGQASFFADDYDKLSDLGIKQAQRLGEYWADRQTEFDEVYAGPRFRQQHTAEHAGAVCRQRGLRWPEPIILPALDEYDLSGLTTHLVPKLAELDHEFAQLVETHRKSQGERDRLREFQRMFESLLRRWQLNDIEGLEVESWLAFQQRVQHVVKQIQDSPGRSRKVAVFTSGGFIGTAVQFALGTSADKALELNWRIRNCSITEFVFTADRFTLDSFNSIPHLTDPELWTHR